MTVAVNDTIEGELVVLGPMSVRLGQEPELGPCPISASCKAERATQRSSTSRSLCARVAAEKGFWSTGASDSRPPCLPIVSGV